MKLSLALASFAVAAARAGCGDAATLPGRRWLPPPRHGDAKGRPDGVAIDNTGALLVADDAGNTVWRVTAAPR